MVALRADAEVRRNPRPEWSPPSNLPTARAAQPSPAQDRLDGPAPRRPGLGFEAKAQDVLPIRDVPKTSSALGRWWGRVSKSSAVKAALLGASSLAVSFGAQLASLRRADGAPNKREIVVLGFNEGVKHEAAQLGRRAPEGVVLVGPAKLQDRALVDGRLVDLASAAGRKAFAESLRLSPESTRALEAALEQTDVWGKDEMARLARVFAEAERGERTLERIVLSGHSLGAGLWGDDNGEVSWKALEAFAKAFPNASRQVEDVMVSACYAGGRTQMADFRAIFPRAKTIWGYYGSAPGAHSGAVWHMARWEKQTRGRGDARVDRAAVKHLRKGKNVAVWTRAKGYDDGRPKRTLERLKEHYARSHDLVPIYLSGAKDVSDPGHGPLREHYGHLQALLQRLELPKSERAPLEVERELVIRLIYYRRISGYFERTHAPALDRAYAALGRERPDFSRLPREAALAEILAFQKATHGADHEDVRQAEALLTDGLRDLLPERIPSSWL